MTPKMAAIRTRAIQRQVVLTKKLESQVARLTERRDAAERKTKELSDSLMEWWHAASHGNRTLYLDDLEKKPGVLPIGIWGKR